MSINDPSLCEYVATYAIIIFGIEVGFFASPYIPETLIGFLILFFILAAIWVPLFRLFGKIFYPNYGKSFANGDET
jgi:hypothetical protein